MLVLHYVLSHHRNGSNGSYVSQKGHLTMIPSKESSGTSKDKLISDEKMAKEQQEPLLTTESNTVQKRQLKEASFGQESKGKVSNQKPIESFSVIVSKNNDEVKNGQRSPDESSSKLVIESKLEPAPLKPPQMKAAETPKSPVLPLSEVEKPKEKTPPESVIIPISLKSVIIPISLEKQIKLVKPSLIITRIFGVTSSTAFGDDMFKYFISKFQTYLSDHWSDPMIQEIVDGLRNQLEREAISELPMIAPSTESKEVVIESISKFITTRSEINKTKPKARASRVVFPDYMKLKSIVIRAGLHNKDIIGQ